MAAVAYELKLAISENVTERRAIEEQLQQKVLRLEPENARVLFGLPLVWGVVVTGLRRRDQLEAVGLAGAADLFCIAGAGAFGSSLPQP